MRPDRFVLAAACVAVLALASGAAGQQGGEAPPDDPAAERLTLDRYFDMEGVGDPRISPDGERIVYARQWRDPMHDAGKSALWIMNADGSRNRHLVEGGSPRWSPSGDRIAFLACGTPGGDRNALQECGEDSERQIWVRIMEGEGAGTVTQVTRLTEGASDIAWSPDGTSIAFNSLVEDEDPYSVTLPDRPEGAEWTESPLVVDRLDWRQDRQGVLPPGHQHIFVVRAEGGTPRQLTHGDCDQEDPVWSPDGSTIYFDGLRIEDADYEMWESEIYALDVATREIRQLTDRNGPDQNPVVSPDGEHIAFVGADSTGRTYLVNELYVMDADGSNPRTIQAGQDRSPGDVTWAPDGSGVYYTVDDHGTTDAWFASTDGEVRQVTNGRHTLSLSDVNRSGTAVAVVSTPHRPEDVVTFPVDGSAGEGDVAALTWLTAVNEDVLGGIELGEVEEIRYESVGGLEIQGWVVKPPDFDPTEQYPLILQIHGGPWAMYDVGFSYAFQNYAANGYVVLYTNPRGSTGYGTDFVDEIDHAYPGQDYDDLMAGVDEVLSRGYVDEENMLVTGCSGGGVLSSWVVGQTDRFAAAVVRCPVVDWFSFVGTTDGPYWYHNFREFPWDDPSEHLERSPLMHVGNVTTPTMLMTGVNDLRTPMSQTVEYYQALKMRKVPTRLIQMADEWHGTGSNPSNFMRTQLYVQKWFTEYMTEGMRERMEEQRVDGS
jgi:dipeptidyl aminopeptidase/acylaminoacyl peptidase